MKRIRVLVVDDSPTMRQLVAHTLSSDPELDVVATAASAIEARELIKLLSPDVMTLDVEMPEMDGLSFLERVMRLRPMPVVMVSTLTAKGTDTAVEALAIGAVDCVAKPTAEDTHSFRDLPAKVKTASLARRAAAPARPPEAAVRPMAEPGAAVVAIGSSTGGVEALIAVISRLPPNCAPTVITQHMPPAFTRSLAERLDRMSAPRVTEATQGAPLRPGLVYLAPGGDRHLEIAGTAALTCALRPGELVNGHCPSVDRLFASVARAAGASAVGVILTGMGRDGASGLAEMRRAGARTIGQDEATSVVYGMPRAAHEIGAVEIQLPLERIGGAIVEATASRHQAE